MSKWKKNSRSLNTEEALILGNPPLPPCLDDDDDHLFNPSLSSSPSSTDRFDPMKNYPSISSLEIDSKNHFHQQQPMEEDRMEVKSRCSIVTGRLTGRSAIKIKERRKRSSVKKKREKKEMMRPSLDSAESSSLVPTDEKRKSSFGTPQSKRLDCRDTEFELMPPPDSHKESVPATSDVDQPIYPNEPTYCVCHQVSHGDMIACDMDNCQGGEWFHYSCIGLTPETRFKGKWYCPTCKLLPFIVSKVKAIALDP